MANNDSPHLVLEIRVSFHVLESRMQVMTAFENVADAKVKLPQLIAQDIKDVVDEWGAEDITVIVENLRS